jgi:hypothetical protein
VLVQGKIVALAGSGRALAGWQANMDLLACKVLSHNLMPVDAITGINGGTI